ncbi:unnamed protein product [Allacma fusca]|uniref:DUF5641 domain-containing protein n=1 Tax=Allacma fusca TaxID=39272 RepID=A0A8J2PR50_9HEXA|nr:unnamed protein product [Allacma fusca]
MNFRIGRSGFTADIQEMFHRVVIRDEDVSAQRFLWRNCDQSKEPQEFEMKAMIFGSKSSPCSAQFVKNINAQRFVNQKPLAVKAILENHYVDDYLHCAMSVTEAQELIRDVIWIHKQGNFNICNWISSSASVLGCISSEMRAKGFKELKASTEFPTERVLGMYWNPNRDSFVFGCPFHKVAADIIDGTRPPTKREMLRYLMSIFDPLGFLSPFTIRGKILMQNCWRAQINWDNTLEGDLLIEWEEWIRLLPTARLIEIPRCYSGYLAEFDSVDLHIFVDASEEAFSAVAYLVVYMGMEVDVALIIARTRLAPLKALSIPRLELQAALMGTRLCRTIHSELDLGLRETHIWTDSKTVMLWLRKCPRDFKPFVSHRISEILECSEKGCRVSTEEENFLAFYSTSCSTYGGSWERLVQSVKKCLRATLKELHPKEETLSTFMAETEFSVNSHPLTHVSVDPTDEEALTPNHFLLGSSGGVYPPGVFVHGEGIKSQWRQAQILSDHFWKRWTHEYLPELTRRTKWHRNVKPIEVNDLVILIDDCMPRNHWPKGRVVSVFPGADGRVQLVEVKTKNGIYKRPVSKCCLLDISPNVTNSTGSPYVCKAWQETIAKNKDKTVHDETSGRILQGVKADDQQIPEAFTQVSQVLEPGTSERIAYEVEVQPVYPAGAVSTGDREPVTFIQVPLKQTVTAPKISLLPMNVESAESTLGGRMSQPKLNLKHNESDVSILNNKIVSPSLEPGLASGDSETARLGKKNKGKSNAKIRETCSEYAKDDQIIPEGYFLRSQCKKETN